MEAATVATANEILGMEFRRLQKSTAQIQNKCAAVFAENFEYAFRWYSEEMYKATTTMEILNEMVAIMGNRELAEVWTIFDERLTQYLDQSWNVRKQSSSACENEASTWKYQVYHTMRQWIREGLKSI